jgi:GH35 family endo-1,4-beta-xylanase
MPDCTERNDPDYSWNSLKIHIEKSANRYKNDLAVWDVVNEERYRTRNPDTGHKVPDDYLVWCFRVADSLFPENVKLLYNDDTKNHDCPSEYVGYVNSVIDSGFGLTGWESNSIYLI